VNVDDKSAGFHGCFFTAEGAKIKHAKIAEKDVLTTTFHL
jgi:hypothetical protein